MTGNTDTQLVDGIVARIGTERHRVVALLREVQRAFNYLPEAALRRLCALTDISPAQIAGVASFYGQFRLEPAGRHTIRVCIGTACHIQGAEVVYDAFRRELGIEGADDTDADRLFTVEKVACLGCCMLAPAVQIDDIVYGPVMPRHAGRVIRDFLRRPSEPEETGGVQPAGAAAGEARLCCCSSCSASGAREVRRELQAVIAGDSLPVTLKTVGCTGLSTAAPLLDVVTAGGNRFRYGRVNPDDVRPILLRHFPPRSAARRVAARVTTLLEKLAIGEETPVVRYLLPPRDDRTSGAQAGIATEHAGVTLPLDIDDYIAAGGFTAARTCLQRDPEATMAVLRASGLRGRGGAGYPAWRKWEAVRERAADGACVICNGDEGDPGAFMDRMILESFPLRVIEGMLIAAIVTGARQGFIYVRAEYPLAVSRLREALALCRRRGMLGDGARGSGRPFDIEVVEGAGAFVCGEETALIAALEGRRGIPRPRPPFPSSHGLWGQPTLVNNVETLACVPWIVRNGAEAFARLGTESSKGTKTFALAGKIVRGGLVEVPMGVTVREIVEDIGGGVPEGRTLKAVQIGGPSGGCLPASLLDTPVDYDALAGTGAIMGSGGLIVLDNTDCMVDVARYFLAFTQDESCGTCTFCRVGTKRMLETLERLCAGHGRAGDIEELEHLAEVVHRGSLCGLGRTAPNPVLTTLRYFRDEYEAHQEGQCPAGACKALIRYVITTECIGCTRCAQRCPVKAISPQPYEQHRVDDALCTRCDTCRAVCPSNAIEIKGTGQK